MKKGTVHLAVISLLFFVACTSSRDKMAEKISAMEKNLQKTALTDSGKVTQLISAYQNFAIKYRNDSAAPEYLYKAAGMASGFHNGRQSIDIFETIIQTYPNYKRIPECYFMLAFAYENSLGNPGKAGEIYNLFLHKYPFHPLADDAKAAIKYLGKSPDEIVLEFNKAKSDSSISLMK